MPVLRNVNPSHSARLGKQTPVIYDGNGQWPTLESINYMPNDQPLNGYVPQYPVSLGSLHIPQSDHQYSYSHQQEPKSCILSDGTLYHSSKTSTSCLASPRKNHSRRREPGHIPRPRNAFIIFRSSYITRCTAEGEGQQNELSKQAGKAWNRMSEEEKRPFTHLAKLEKMQHQAMYPNYIYSPGRRRQGTASTKRTSEPSAPSVSSKSTTAENPSAAPTLRLPHPATQLVVQRYFSSQSIPPSPPSMSPPREDSPIQEIFDFASPEFNPLDKMEVVRPIVSPQASESDASVEEDDFVPTADIPELELTPSKNKKPEHVFDLSMRPSHLDHIPEQFGFKYDNDFMVMLAHLHPMLDLNDMASTRDASPSYSQLSSLPSTSDDIFEYLMTDDIRQSPTAHLKVSHQSFPDFLSCSRTSSPAKISTTPTSPFTPVLFPVDGNIPNHSEQEPTNDLATLLSRESILGFTWSSDHQRKEWDDGLKSDMILEEENGGTFMSSIFDFDSFDL